MQDTGELVRPYAIAAFQQAQQEGKLSEWSDMLALFETIVRDPVMAGLIVNPKADNQQVTSLILDVGGDHLVERVPAGATDADDFDPGARLGRVNKFECHESAPF